MLAQIATTPILARFATNAVPVRHMPPSAEGHLDGLMLFSFLGMVATLVCYIEMRRSNSFRLAFAVGLAVMAICGIIQGVLALSILAALLSASTFRQWNDERKLLHLWNKPASCAPIAAPSELYGSESRITRLFGSADVDQERWKSAS
jgi:hypothetical protein